MNTIFVLGGTVLLISFILTVFLTKRWIKIAKKAGLVGKDMNKYKKPKIPEGGGISVVLGICLGILSYIFLKTFFIGTETHLIETFAVLLSIILAGLLGFVDDVLGWKIGLRQWQKPLLTIPIAIPLVVISAGTSSMSLPFLGPTELGLLYPLIIVPIGIIGASNGFNMLAGMNGLESGMGIIITGVLGFVSFSLGELWLSLICFSVLFSLIGFLIFNKYPSKVFPGDSLTYSIGALIAMVAILGNMEKIAVILFIPYFVEFLFKLKNKFQTECFGKPKKDGSLEPPEKTGSLIHFILKFVDNEKKAVFLVLLIEFLIGLFIILKVLL